MANPVGWNEHPNPYFYYFPDGSPSGYTSQLKLREMVGNATCKAGTHKWNGGVCKKCDVERVGNPGYTKRIMPNRSRCQ